MSTRAFSTTPSRRKGIPTFTQTSNPELDDVLSTFRTKHFIPSALGKRERKLIVSPKTKQFLEENPQIVTIGDEDIELKWLNRTKDIPPRTQLLRKALQLMREGEKSDWNQLPSLLAGLKSEKYITSRQMAKIVRLATNSGRFGTVLQCLHQAHNTGMTMKKEHVLEAVISGLRQIASDEGWSQEAMERAIRDSKEVAMQLEDEEHGSGSYVTPGDPRRRPEVLSVFLELAAVYAWKFQDGKDVDGKVKAYAERLLSNIKGAESPNSTTPDPAGPQLEMMRGISIFQGLVLSKKILGSDMPMANRADEVIRTWRSGLESMAEMLREDEKVSEPGSYGEQAIKAWSECVRE